MNLNGVMNYGAVAGFPAPLRLLAELLAAAQQRATKITGVIAAFAHALPLFEIRHIERSLSELRF